MQFEMPLLQELSTGNNVVEMSALNLTATYYDTEDLQLVRNGVTLRYRTGDSEGAGWTLKLPLPDEASVRDEIHMAGARNRVPTEAYHLTTAFARGAALAPVARIRTQRRRWSLRDDAGEDLAELADDRVSVLDGRRTVERFREIEVESRGLNKAGLQRIASVLKGAGAAATQARCRNSRVPWGRSSLPSDIPVSQMIAGLRSRVRCLLRGSG